ncbi:MAG: DsrE family protein [Gammaproteobacteria bacterium]|jgi:uncharacterized protein
MYRHRHLLISLLTVLLFASGLAAAEEFTKPNRLVIQVSTDDVRTQTIAMNNAVNLQKHYGPENVAVEIVAYGPGLGMLTKNSEHAQRVSSLAMQDIKFSACENTMKKVEKKKGKMPELAEGVGTVPAGVVRIMELQGEGYAYIRP